MNGFTGGPWVAHQGWANPISGDGTLTEFPHWCEVTGPRNPDSGQTASATGHFGIANARLMAAAPALHQAAEAMAAWFWAENTHETSWESRLELCNYTEYLTNKALALADGRELPQSYEGMPRIVVSFPRAGLERHEADEVQATVNELLVKYRAAIAKATGGDQ